MSPTKAERLIKAQGCGLHCITPHSISFWAMQGGLGSVVSWGFDVDESESTIAARITKAAREINAVMARVHAAHS